MNKPRQIKSYLNRFGKLESLGAMSEFGTSATSRGDPAMSAQECQSGHAAEIVEDRPLCQRQRRRSRSMRYSLFDLLVPELMPEIDTIRAQFFETHTLA
jgi:hypothetical protein